MSIRTSYRIVIITAVFLTLAGAHYASAVGIGAKIGLSFARQDFKYASSVFTLDTDTRLGPAAGVFAERSILSYLSLRAEALYIQKGFKIDLTVYSYSGESSAKTLHYRLDYLSINALAKASLPSHTYLVAGPRLDVRLGIHDDMPDIVPHEIEDKYKATVFGATFGIGQEINLAAIGAIFIEGQYYLDFGNVYDYEPRGDSKIGTLTAIENQAFAVLVGLRF
jgi:hypothetical protein